MRTLSAFALSFGIAAITTSSAFANVDLFECEGTGPDGTHYVASIISVDDGATTVVMNMLEPRSRAPRLYSAECKDEGSHLECEITQNAKWGYHVMLYLSLPSPRAVLTPWSIVQGDEVPIELKCQEQ